MQLESEAKSADEKLQFLETSKKGNKGLKIESYNIAFLIW